MASPIDSTERSDRRPRVPRAELRAAFTLIELLVVITIIVIVIALLTPALDRAVDEALRAKCLVNQRLCVSASLGYAMESRGVMPPFTMPGLGNASGWDMRAGAEPMGLGRAVYSGHLPAQQLGKVIHCPLLDTMGIPIGNAGHNMDTRHASGVGGSWWTDPAYAGQRIIPGFMYRAASYYTQGRKKPDGTREAAGYLKLTHANSAFIISSDTLDYRVGIKYHHLTIYQLAFGDGHANAYPDPEHEVEAIIANRNVDGTSNPWLDETLYDHMEGKP